MLTFNKHPILIHIFQNQTHSQHRNHIAYSLYWLAKTDTNLLLLSSSSPIADPVIASNLNLRSFHSSSSHQPLIFNAHTKSISTTTPLSVCRHTTTLETLWLLTIQKVWETVCAAIRCSNFEFFTRYPNTNEFARSSTSYDIHTKRFIYTLFDQWGCSSIYIYIYIYRWPSALTFL